MTLTWDDLLIQDVTAADFGRWIGEWRGVVTGETGLAFLNKFGVWFLRRPDGPVDMLDVFTGDVDRLAESHAEFATLVNDPAWQEVYLLSKLVDQLHDVGKIPGRGECYAVAPPAAFGGPNPMAGEVVPLDRVTIMPVFSWQVICAQSVGGRAQE